MDEPRIKRLNGTVADYVYEISLKDYVYKVKFSESYYQELTQGKVSPEDLVKESFKFLLEREGPESILPEFDLPLINHYFPEYESTIQNRL